MTVNIIIASSSLCILHVVLLLSVLQFSLSYFIQQNTFHLVANIIVATGVQYSNKSKFMCASICNQDYQCLGFSKELLDTSKVCKLVYNFLLVSSGGELCYVQVQLTGFADGALISQDSNVTISSNSSSTLTSIALTEVPTPTSSSSSEETTSSTSIATSSSLSSTTSSTTNGSTTLSSIGTTTASSTTTINYQTQLVFGSICNCKRSGCSNSEVLVGFGLPTTSDDLTDLICLSLANGATVVDTQTATSSTVPCSQATPGLLAFANLVNTKSGYERNCYPLTNGWAVKNYTVIANLTSSVSSFSISGTASGKSYKWALCPVSSEVWALDSIFVNGASSVITSIQCVKLG